MKRDLEEKAIQAIVDIEAEGFQSDLESVESHKQKVAATVRKNFDLYREHITRALIALLTSKKLEEEEVEELRKKFENFSLPKEGVDRSKVPQDYYQLSDRFYEMSYALGVEALDAEDYEKALDLFVMLTNFQPNEYVYSLHLGVTAFHLGNFDLALLAFSNALILTEIDTPIVMLWIADTLKELGQEDDAKDVVKQVIDLVSGEEDYTDVFEIAKGKLI